MNNFTIDEWIISTLYSGKSSSYPAERLHFLPEEWNHQFKNSNHQPATQCTFNFNPSMHQATAKQQSPVCTRAHSSILISFITLIISSLVFNLADWEICTQSKGNKQTPITERTNYILLRPAYCPSHPPTIHLHSFR